MEHTQRVRRDRLHDPGRRLSAKLPRDVTGERFIRAAERAGFVVERHGKHPVLVRESDRRTVPVPVHGSKRIGPGLLRKLLRQTGLTVEQFSELL
ncbi:MAG: type II toxin-antitoxin system HicA family toxin [Myxococcota bacterium]